VRLFRSASAYIFFAALVYAPWAYGGTTVESIEVINILLAVALFFWVVDLALGRRAPACPPLLFFLIVGIVALGGWMVCNAAAIYDSSFETFTRLERPAPRLAGSLDYAISAAWMIRATLLLGVTLFVVDLAQDRVWLLRLWWTIGLVAGSVALLGLLQKATGAGMIFWRPGAPGGQTTFFAAYYYHGNAGAYLNLVLPLTTGLAVRSFITPANAGIRALWSSIFVLTLVAIFANTSRMAQAIGIVLLIAIGFRFKRRLMDRFSRVEKNIALGGAAAIVLALWAVAQATHLEQPIQRWQHLGENFTADARWLSARIVLRQALPEVGLCGFGPGTFRAVFPSFNLSSNAPAEGTWRFLHNDYLQTIMEWGWAGAGLWAVVFFGGIIVGWRRFRSADARAWSPRRRLLLPLAVIALAGVAVHALVDFPLQIASIQLYAATYLGICWASALWKSAA